MVCTYIYLEKIVHMPHCYFVNDYKQKNRDVWELLKGLTLAGVAALDRVCTRNLDWRAIFRGPCQLLFVDVGNGNGLFILKWLNRMNI